MLIIYNHEQARRPYGEVVVMRSFCMGVRPKPGLFARLWTWLRSVFGKVFK
jgi:hypothetical protein